MISALDTSLLQKTGESLPGSDELKNFLQQLSRTADDNAIDRVISLYEKTIVKLEQDIWKNEPASSDIEQYQNAFTVLEKLHELKTVDTRYHFKIVIPVADRPMHLKNCLNSLLTLCKHYGYGGFKNKRFSKVSVLIADDSSDAGNIALHQSYCSELSKQGVNTEYFGLEEQLDLARESVARNDALSRIISDTKDVDDLLDFSHKGASIMRNITYLKLNQLLSNDDNNSLIYFIDSDQEFCINTAADSEAKHYAINYFHYLNDIFKTRDISILTGKVVGDPPVSPSVMAGNFQQDIQNFLMTIKKLNPGEPCRFHRHEKHDSDDAAYHDMANLFGFSKHEQAFEYHCTLKGKHSNSDCFAGFSDKLSHFFYGEHPTRKTFFHYDAGFSQTVVARTVYTGNYVIKPENLDHFIPFATLKLRMAGPVLGRILNASLYEKFVSANLPMLHNRTVDKTGQAEFRAGVQSNETTIDLGNEFIRQFYGDVMLFSIKYISEQKLSYADMDEKQIQSIISETYETIKTNYLDKHEIILQLKSSLTLFLNNKNCWWNTPAEKTKTIDQAKVNFFTFLKNIEINFDETGNAFQQILPDNAEKHLSSILQAILHYQCDTDNWKITLTR